MHTVIIGNGISGITAARHVRKLGNNRITVISAETDYFFSRTALMYIYMGHMRMVDTQPYPASFWKKNRIELLRAKVERVDFETKTLHLSEGATPLVYDQLVLATGSQSNKFGWPGQDLDGVAGMYSHQDLTYLEDRSAHIQRAVIVGGGLIGIELAEMLHSRHIPVTLLVREESYWNNILPPEESAMISRHIRQHGFDLRLGEELASIEGDGQGRVAAVVTKSGERIPCQYVGLTAGVSPNVGFLKGSGLDIDRGILVDEYLRTNMPDVYALGDCVQLRNPRPGRRAIEAVWYTGRMMGETVAHTICGKPTAYDPGIWFNSAKFLDIEYQVYGDVPARMPDDMATLYWEHPAGDKAIRINYHKTEGHVLGFNLMGIRYSHEQCERWLAAKTPLAQVLKELPKANFDPEFYAKYEDRVAALVNV